MSQFTLTEEDKGKTLTIHQGDQATISLKENPTTGYRWTMDKIDNTLLALNQTSYTQSSDEGLGRGGRCLFVLDAKRPGTAHLQLKRWRAWEGDKSITERFDVTLQITPHR